MTAFDELREIVSNRPVDNSGEVILNLKLYKRLLKEHDETIQMTAVASDVMASEAIRELVEALRPLLIADEFFKLHSVRDGQPVYVVDADKLSAIHDVYNKYKGWPQPVADNDTFGGNVDDRN